MKEQGTPRSLAHTSKKSAKFRNPKGAAKYFKAYNEEIEPNQVVIPVIPMKDSLHKDIWTEDETLRPKIKIALLKIAKEFAAFIKTDFPVKDIYFTGSMANFNWTDNSDIDLHLLLDYSGEDEDFITDYMFAKKAIWNDKYKITVKGFPVEPFAKNVEGKYPYKAIYSLKNDEWVVKPKKSKVDVDDYAIREKASNLMNLIDGLEDIKNNKTKIKKAESIQTRLGKMRQSGLENGGEFSIENLTFKTLRRNGYMEKLGAIKDNSFDKMLTVDEEAVSDKQRKFMNMALDCKENGNCPSSSIKKVANSMNKSSISDFAHTKGKLPNKVNEDFDHMGVLPVVHTLKVQNDIDGMSDQKVEVIKDFINFACGKLGIYEPVTVCLRRGRDEYIQTTASYVPSENENHIRCGGRALVDIMRSTAHELTHNLQRQEGKFKIGEPVQNIGGTLEGDADAKAGILIKDFTHNNGYDGIYDL